MIRLSEDINKTCLKAILREIKYLINNKTILVQEKEKGEHMTPCMDGYKSKIQSYVSLNRLKFENRG